MQITALCTSFYALTNWRVSVRYFRHIIFVFILICNKKLKHLSPFIIFIVLKNKKMAVYLFFKHVFPMQCLIVLNSLTFFIMKEIEKKIIHLFHVTWVALNSALVQYKVNWSALRPSFQYLSRNRINLLPSFIKNTNSLKVFCYKFTPWLFTIEDTRLDILNHIAT